jgi:hypothetical protein
VAKTTLTRMAGPEMVGQPELDPRKVTGDRETEPKDEPGASSYARGEAGR